MFAPAEDRLDNRNRSATRLPINDSGSLGPPGGVSLLLTGSLVLLVWLLGALQLMASFITEHQGFIAFDLAQRVSDLASQLWLGKGIACFAIFYMIIALSLHGRIKGHRAKAAGAAAGALAWLGATWAFHIYLRFSALDSFYGALASVILGFIWLSVSVSSLLLGAALAVEWASRLPHEVLLPDDDDDVDEGSDDAVTAA